MFTFPPIQLVDFGRNAVDRYFTPAEIKGIVALADHVVA